MVDVVIPVYKPSTELITVIQKLSEQTVPVNRIILINTEKDFFDEKLFLCNDKTEVHHISKSEFDHGATRNMGIELSDADYVLFLTMDAIPKDSYLVERLLDGLKKSGPQGEKVAVAYGRQLPKKDCRLMEKYTRAYNYGNSDLFKTKADIAKMGIKTYFCSDVCAMYDRKIYLNNGGFEKKMIFNEDMVYAAKAIDKGFGVFYASTACVYHSHNYSCKDQFKRNFDLGVSQTDYRRIFDAVPSESEGIKMVKATVKFLCKKGHWYDIPYFVVNTAAKYLGYKLGRHYKGLSYKKIMKLTSNKEYWKYMKE